MKKDSWKSRGHYLKDGTEWKGHQHAHNGKIMTGKSHTSSSKSLYHYMDLSASAKKKVEKIPVIDAISGKPVKPTKKKK